MMATALSSQLYASEVETSAKSDIPAILLPARPAPSGRTELQQRQKQSSREKLLAAAYEVFAESSYAGAAIDDIVKRAGVNRSTFYRHFDSKFAMNMARFGPPIPSPMPISIIGSRG
jgi:hypothetical protein